MKIIYQIIIAICFGLLAAIIGHLIVDRLQTPKGHSANTPKEKQQEIADFIEKMVYAMYPIKFHGKVVDQHGEAVKDATISVFYGDRGVPPINMKSDSNGRFFVKKIKVPIIVVNVKKEGYLGFFNCKYIEPECSQNISIRHLNQTKKGLHKDPAHPILFQLCKLMPSEPHIYIHHQPQTPPLDGTSNKITLDSKTGEGPHAIEYKYNFNGKQQGRLWYIEASIPGGGFQKRSNHYQFEAPESGYVETIRHDDKWKESESRCSMDPGYFVKFPDGTHGYIELPRYGSFYINSFMNLKPGSRNLSPNEKNGFPKYISK
jgi:hypothetical protein